MSSADLRINAAFNQIDPTGMKWRGSWGIIGIYQQDEVVLGPDNESYICIDPTGSIGEDPSTNPAVWQLLSSGTATAVSVSTSNGSGITVAEPTPNNFTVATNLVAGSGIGFTPSGVNSSLTVANTGVLGVTSSSAAITVGGTAQNPILTQALPALAPGVTIIDGILNPASVVQVSVTSAGPPAGTQILNLPVVPGARYLLTSSVTITSNNPPTSPPPLTPYGYFFLARTAGAGQPPTPGTPVNIILQVPQSTTGQGTSTAVTFTVPSGVTSYGVYLQALMTNVSDVITGVISSLYLTRLA